MSIPIVLAFSGGKDSVLALAALRASGYEVRALIANFAEGDELLAMHRVPRPLIEGQAACLGVPLVAVHLPHAPSNEIYEERLATALRALAVEGVRHIAFGDLFLEDIRRYRDTLMRRLGFSTVYPLWGRDTRELARTFVDRGYRGLTVCIDTEQLACEYVGAEMDEAFFEGLPRSVDVCGENGEFHSFVYDGPGFAYPVRFARGPVMTTDRFHYQAIMAIDGVRCARCDAPMMCGMRAGLSECWCARAPAIEPRSEWQNCLCPRCLEEVSRP